LHSDGRDALARWTWRVFVREDRFCVLLDINHSLIRCEDKDKRIAIKEISNIFLCSAREAIDFKPGAAGGTESIAARKSVSARPRWIIDIFNESAKMFRTMINLEGLSHFRKPVREWFDKGSNDAICSHRDDIFQAIDHDDIKGIFVELTR
jgi:hypothetical protein